MAPWSGCARTAVERHPESRTNCVCVCVCVCVRARARVCVGVMCLRVVLGRVHASSLPPRHRRTDAQDGHDPHTGAARELTVTFAHPGTSSHSRKRCMCVCVYLSARACALCEPDDETGPRRPGGLTRWTRRRPAARRPGSPAPVRASERASEPSLALRRTRKQARLFGDCFAHGKREAKARRRLGNHDSRASATAPHLLLCPPVLMAV